MNVVYSCSDSFSPITGVAIQSLLHNNTDVEELNVFLIENNISQENKEKFNKLAKMYNRSLYILPNPDLNQIAGLEINIGRWNISTYSRLFVCSLLPDYVDKCITLDADTLVRHSLKELWETDLEDKLVAAVDDCRSDLYKKDLGLTSNSTYTNNGVLLIDVKGWREQNVQRQFVEFIKKYNGDTTYVDQGVLNGVLAKQNLVKVIHTKYNAMSVFFDFNYKDLLKLRKPQHHLSEQEYNETVQDPYVLHFTSCFMSGTRPWNEHNDHPYVGDYLKYKSMGPWADTPQLPDDRKALKKLMTKICRILPKPVMIWAISIVHAKLYPMLRIRKSKKRGVYENTTS